MEIRFLEKGGMLWNELKEYATNCSWDAGKYLAKDMDDGYFTDWQGVFAVIDEGKICGFCNVIKEDCVPGKPYTPYIGYVFVGEEHRGQRLSGKMIDKANEYLKGVGFDRTYLISSHNGLYEKYGYTPFDEGDTTFGDHVKFYYKDI